MKQIIDSLGMTLYRFSKHYNIPYATVFQWYKGQRTPPDYVVRLFRENIELKKQGTQLSFLDEQL